MKYVIRYVYKGHPTDEFWDKFVYYKTVSVQQTWNNHLLRAVYAARISDAKVFETREQAEEILNDDKIDYNEINKVVGIVRMTDKQYFEYKLKDK